MKKSVKIRVFSLIAASLVLCGALTVAAVMGSPYETLKKAALDALTYRNATVEGRAALTVNGELRERQKAFYAVGDESCLAYSFDENGEENGYTYNSEGLTISRSYMGANQKQWYSAYIRPADYYGNYTAYQNGFGIFKPEDRDSAQMRFFELLADALVGDLKNNVTMSQNGETRLIQAALTESQIPELIKAGIDMLIEQAGSRYYDWKESISGGEYIWEQILIENGMKTVTVYKQDARPMDPAEQEAMYDGSFWDEKNGYWGTACIDGIQYIILSDREYAESYTVPATSGDFDQSRNPLDMPMKSLAINYARGEAEVDAEGNMLSLEVELRLTAVSILGDTNVVELNAELKFSDIGTTEAACPIPGAKQILGPEYIKANFGFEKGTVFFTLNEDGSIDANSLTTTYPGEYERSAVED